ncbi:MAG TPA: NUDIX hydrolase [Acidimicrobiia bacterium]|jgi:8-oxo-dGTP diphosphatase|nr:NUDIX hydrolase [Acidimicrobiia bacterium]
MTSGGTRVVKAAGAVVHRTGERGTEVLLAHRPKYDDWSLPKGGLDDGESYEQAAVREVEEETGFTGELGAHVGAVGYAVRNEQKVVHYWLLAANGGSFAPNLEVDAVEWLPPKKALRLLSYRRDVNVVAQAVSQLRRPKAAVVHFVRHANAGQRSSWTKDDHLRPLSKKGLRQARTISRRLLEVPVATIRSSYYERCKATVRPLADALDCEVVHEPALAEGTPPEEVVDYLRTLRGTTAVLCSHGDVISNLIGHLAAEGVRFESPLQWKKGSVWTLELRKGKVVGGKYTPPPSG